MQLKYMLAFSALVFAAPSLGGPIPKSAGYNLILNSGFELTAAEDKALPIHWNIDVANKTDASEIVALDNKLKHCGKLAVRVRFNEAMNYSGVIQSIDVSNFIDKTLYFSGFLRKSSEQSIVGIWILAADGNNKKLEYVNSYNQLNEAGKDWLFHSISIRVPKGASKIKLGAAIYEKDGIMWADDLSLSTAPIASKSCNMGNIK